MSTNQALKNAAPLTAQVRFVGRFEVLPPSGNLRFAWPNSAIGINFDGDSLNILLAEEAQTYINDVAVHNMFEVVIDGEASHTLSVDSTQVRPYTVAQDLPPGPHTAWLFKRTEAFVGSTIFAGFDAPSRGRLLPPPLPKARRIEVYGASNEAGYGNTEQVTSDTMCPYTHQTQNALNAYPALAAAALDAELVNIAFSGKGIAQNYDPDRDREPMPMIAHRIEPARKALWVSPAATDAPPNVIVVSLGPNDFSRGPPNRQGFQQAYTSFLQDARKRNPNAPIISIITAMAKGRERDILRRLIHKSVAKACDPNVHILEFPQYNGSTYGCDFHPDQQLHDRMGAMLQAKIATVARWQLPEAQ